MQKQVTCIVLGAGQRGQVYASYALDFPDHLKVVAVAESRSFYRKKLACDHDIEESYIFNDWKDLLDSKRLADFAIIALPDHLHKAAAIAMAEKHYDILLEKPMAVSYADCVLIHDVCQRNNVLLCICHVLRYTPPAKRIHQMIKDGAIGDIVNIQLLDPVGYWHFAHSFVRGNWCKEADSSFSLLTKCCHDLDLIIYWMSAQHMKCQQIQSFGSLKHFTSKNKPLNSSSRCTNCPVESECVYSAKKLYMNMIKQGHTGFPVHIICEVPDIENVTEALNSGPYGRCVYDCDNDVVDNQVVNLTFNAGVTASFTMIAFTKDVGRRKVRIFGTKGEINCDFVNEKVEYTNFFTDTTECTSCEHSDSAVKSRMSDHSWADFYNMSAFVKAVSMGKQVTCVVLGAGQRGQNYASYSLDFPKEFKVVGVADVRPFYRKSLASKHNVNERYVFDDWNLLKEEECFADCAIISLPDRLHKDAAIAMAEKGYHILLEKPMAVSYSDCLSIHEACKRNKVFIAICHVLRYTPPARRIYELLHDGVIGDIVNIQLLEPVGYWHFAHSYVRGNWRNEAGSSFSLLTKSCHDLDLINYWMGAQQLKCQQLQSFGSLKHFTSENKVGYWHFAHSFVRGNWRKESSSSFSLLTKSCHDLDLISYWMNAQDLKCEQIQSFGSLKHFTHQNKPPGATSRCVDCPVESTCVYSAKKLYLGMAEKGHTGFPMKIICEVPDIENVTEALNSGPYGRCVYDCDNDVVDNQVVNMTYSGGVTASFTMIAFTRDICTRKVRIFGTKGELSCDFKNNDIQHFDFLNDTNEIINWSHSESANKSRLKGHGSADFYNLAAFIKAVATNDPSEILTGPDVSIEAHGLVFLAEKSRKENCVLEVNQSTLAAL